MHSVNAPRHILQEPPACASTPVELSLGYRVTIPRVWGFPASAMAASASYSGWALPEGMLITLSHALN